MHEVWITGAGVVSALGTGMESLEQAALNCRSGLKRYRLFNGAPPDPCVCGKVPPEIVPGSLEESAHNRADLLLGNALDQALISASLRKKTVDADMIVGTTLGNMHGGSRYYEKWRKGKSPALKLVRNFLLFSPANTIANRYAITGKCTTISSACGSASAAIGQAFYKIRYGLSSRVITGGFDSLSPFVVAGFNSLRLVSSSECRPFDINRNGMSPGEGAGIVVLESKESALSRGVIPIAKIEGFGESLEAYHYTRAHPRGEGVFASVSKAIHCASLTPERIDHIHTHGTGTKANDISEFAALTRIFGRHLHSIPICSTKSMTGHTFGAAGVLNMLFTLQSLKTKMVPPTLFHETLDPEFDGACIAGTPQTYRSMNKILTTALGFGGESFAIIVSRVENDE
jgi:3-oxoacyl-(acyl-carrier-protein) synthase